MSSGEGGGSCSRNERYPLRAISAHRWAWTIDASYTGSGFWESFTAARRWFSDLKRHASWSFMWSPFIFVELYRPATSSIGYPSLRGNGFSGYRNFGIVWKRKKKYHKTVSIYSRCPSASDNSFPCCSPRFRSGKNPAGVYGG